MASEISAAIQAGRRAGEILRNQFSKPHQEIYKGTIDIVTEMDREAENLIYAMLKREFPTYDFLGEESRASSRCQVTKWIVDPLDGTTNYARGYPFFNVSIALEKKGEVVVGVVYNPILDEMFMAEKGSGAQLNGSPIRVSQTAELEKSLLASGFPYDAWSNPANNCKEWERFIKRVISLRCDGSAALDLCHVAAGRLDGYWEWGLEAWDMAAGALIVEEAGGVVSLTSGASFTPYKRSILATNGKLHEQMMQILNPTQQLDGSD